MFARLIVGVGVLVGLSEESPARVIRREEDWRSMIRRRSGGRRVEDDVVVDLGRGDRGGE